MKARHSRSRSQAGYFLLSVMLLITIMLIFLAAELPRLSQQIKRAREEELVNRGMEYAKAVKKYRRKMGAFPNSIDQLQDTNHIRFLRKRYKDPMTGEDDWKIVHLGEAEIQLPKGNNPGLQGSGDPGLKGGTFKGGANTGGGASTGGATADGKTQLLGNAQSGGGSSLGSLQVSNPGGGQTLGGPGIIGVVSTSKKTGIKEFHDSNRYDEWLFVYDPRLEQAAGANGGGTAGITVAAPRAGGASGGGSSGGAVGSGPVPGNPPPGNPPLDNQPPGNAPPGGAPPPPGSAPPGSTPPTTGTPTPSPTPQ